MTEAVGRDANTTPILSLYPAAMSSRPDTVVFIPAWNEEAEPPGVLAELATALPDADVLVIDDGSTDATAAVAREAGAIVVSFGENRGLRAGIAAGYREAHERGYAFCGRVDADGQHPADELARLLELVRSDVCDVAVGSRFAAGRGLRRRPLPAVAEPALRDRVAAEGDARAARPPVPRPDERDGRGQREGDARDGAAVRERCARGGGAPAAEGGGAAGRGGRRPHARARERRVEAAGEEGASSSC